MTPDTAEILRAIALIIPPGQVTEVRALEATTTGYGRPRTIFGYFDDPAALVAALAGIATAKGIYFTPNPVNPALLARASNRLKDAGKSENTSDKDITRRRWLLVDCDPVRPAGISADEWEHDAAIDRACAIRSEMCRQGWPEPIIADSGNGGHLLYRVDLPADDGGMVKRCLEALAAQHSDKVISVDTTVFNPARIWKLYGSLACKGDSTAQRPHRMARIIDALATLDLVTRAQLEALAGVATPPRVSGHTATGNGFAWLDQWLVAHSVPVGAPAPWRDGRIFVFEVCPFNPDHANASAFITQGGNGAIGAGCHHNGCKILEWGWRDLRTKFDPQSVRQPPPPGPHPRPRGRWALEEVIYG